MNDYMVKFPDGRALPAPRDRIRTLLLSGTFQAGTQFHRIKWPDELNPFIRRDYHPLEYYEELLKPPTRPNHRHYLSLHPPASSSPLPAFIVFGLLLGASLGFLVRPAFAGQQLPLGAILAGVTGNHRDGPFSDALVGFAQTSLNYMIAGAILGILAAFICNFFYAQSQSAKR